LGIVVSGIGLFFGIWPASLDPVELLRDE